ncbi:MAG: GDSL-type esterase/lipase family protein [Oscillospiraceae bacterium]|nr:GDSL-type esterase/lipase family protein [Oscillospiraceae bacterium]
MIICIIANKDGLKAMLEPVALRPAAPGGQADAGDVMPVPDVAPGDPAVVPMSGSEQWWLDRHGEKAGEIRDNPQIVFIGDSITQRWEEEGQEAWQELRRRYGDRILNLGFGSDKTQNVIWRLENGEFPVGTKPRFIVLMVGTNNLLFTADAAQSVAAGIGEIIEILHSRSPKSKIILCSILPSAYNGGTAGLASKISEANGIIMKYDGYRNVSYLDIARYYADDSGQMYDGLFVDGIHLAPEGYAIWMDKIIETIGESGWKPRPPLLSY